MDLNVLICKIILKLSYSCLLLLVCFFLSLPFCVVFTIKLRSGDLGSTYASYGPVLRIQGQTAVTAWDRWPAWTSPGNTDKKRMGKNDCVDAESSQPYCLS